MEDGAWLTKSEVNALYYNTVAGEISFVTEASIGYQPRAVARLIANHARGHKRRQIRVLEIGANDCGFARELIAELRRARNRGEAELDRLDYLAVEYARPSLEAVAAWEAEHGTFDRVIRGPDGGSAWHEPPKRPTMVALAVVEDELAVNLGLVHAEANQFVRSNSRPFDIVVLNELLDDMPCRAYFADAEGTTFEVVPECRLAGEHWTVRVTARSPGDADLGGMPPGTITGRSPEAVELVTGIAGMLAPGGMLVVHDYGFAERFTSLESYEGAPGPLPSFATMDFRGPSGHGFPRSFFRVFGNEARRVVQVTNDVNFAELAAALEGSGTVLTIPHGSAIHNRGETFEERHGVFLAEFNELDPGEDLPALLARLQADQARIRDDYVREYTGGRGNVFLDLVYVKS